MKELSDVIVKLSAHYQAELIDLSIKLSRYLPPTSILAIDCVPRKKHLNAFHYVDGRDDAETFFILQGKQEHAGKILKKTQKFHINYQAGVDVGLWSQLGFFDYENKINWDEAFVVKKASGEMHIYDPTLIHQRNKGKISAYVLKSRGISTKVAIVKFLHQPGANFYQKYHEPLCGPQESHRLSTYRMLILLEKGEKIKTLGGLWTSTPANTNRLKGVNDVRIGLIQV